MDDFSLLVVTSQISGQALYLGGVGSTRERSVDICSRLLPLDERLYLAPSARVTNDLSANVNRIANGFYKSVNIVLKISNVCFLHADGLCFPTRGIGLIASTQEIPCSALMEATNGDSPLPLALLVEATAGVDVSYDSLVEATTVSLLEPSKMENACSRIACGL
ncbi:hypothetical protein TNCV_2437101 [Trichonephila clavipes]|nr:hypothetical protein TNCV_2437101 [Trichonephila clavipes]